MQALRIHMKNYRAFLMMLILAFSLSPCSVKRDVLNIFDIQYISGLNKVKTVVAEGSVCDLSAENSSNRTAFAKSDLKIKSRGFALHSNTVLYFGEVKITFNDYSGHASGNSPPKYILFKRLKLNLV